MNMNGTESALVLNALSETQLFSSPALSATDLLSSKLEIQAEILNHWRYTAITGGIQLEARFSNVVALKTGVTGREG